MCFRVAGMRRCKSSAFVEWHRAHIRQFKMQYANNSVRCSLGGSSGAGTNTTIAFDIKKANEMGERMLLRYVALLFDPDTYACMANWARM